MSIENLKEVESLRNGPAILNRISWIDAQLNWVGEFNRNELVQNFGISKQQASADINLYSELAPKNFSFNHSLKVFCASDGFTPLFEQDAFQWLQERQSGLAGSKGIGLEDLRGIPQHVEPVIFRVINRCRKREMPARIKVGSLSSDEVREDTICPHSIVSTPIRWHVRAWSQRKQSFIDLPIGRIVSAEAVQDGSWVPVDADVAWQRKVSVVLAPADYLSPRQRKIIMTAYGMEEGQVAIETRECLVYYLLASMQLLNAVREYSGEALNPNLRVRVVNYKSLLPLVTSAASEQEIPSIDLSEDIAVHDTMRSLAEPVSDNSMRGQAFVWLGSGLAKIAASYANDLCISKGISSRFVSPLEYNSTPRNEFEIPMLVTLAGKGDDAVDTAHCMAARGGKAGIVTCNAQGDACMTLGSTLHYGICGPFPERDKRFINLRSVIALASLAETSVQLGSELPSEEKIDLAQLSSEANAVAREIAMRLTAQPNWYNKQCLILGKGFHNCHQQTWCSILAEAGICTPIWKDIKDYTHGDHRTASLQKNQVFLLVGDSSLDSFFDIFEQRFSTCFPLGRIRLEGGVRAQFWLNLFCALSLTHHLSHKRGYEGARPPKDPLIHSWRGWGRM